MINAFKEAYPFMVLILGFSAVLNALFASVVMAAGSWFEVSHEFTPKVFQSSAILIGGHVLAVALLAGVAHLLGAL